MPKAEPQITVALTNGEKLTFVLPSEEAMKSHLCPHAQAVLFDPPDLLLGNGISLFGVRTSAIAWIRIYDSIELPWEYPFGAALIEWIPEEVFQKTVPLKRIATMLAITHEPVGTNIQPFLRLHCGDRSLQHFRITTHILSKTDRLHLPDAIGQLSLYFAKHPEGGWLIVNPKTLMHWETFPGPVDLPETVWPLLRFEDEHNPSHP